MLARKKAEHKLVQQTLKPDFRVIGYTGTSQRLKGKQANSKSPEPKLVEEAGRCGS